MSRLLHSLQSQISKFLKVLPFTRFSDHCPLTIRLHLKNKFFVDSNIYKFDRFPTRYKWDDNSSTDYSCELNSETSQKRFESILTKEINGEFKFSVDENSYLCQEFTNIIIDAADKSLKKHKIPKTLPKNKWFTYECKQRKQSLYHHHFLYLY